MATRDITTGRFIDCSGTDNPTYRHGLSQTPTYDCFRNMHQRCSNPKNVGYANYGGRGIKVCSRWSIVDNFVEDMGLKPDGLTIDRIDNDGDYTPENCKWSTPLEQGQNKRVYKNARLVTFDGLTLSVSEWSRRTGINATTIEYRLGAGWSVEKAITHQPPSKAQ